jgi:hypothetical protein
VNEDNHLEHVIIDHFKNHLYLKYLSISQTFLYW